MSTRHHPPFRSRISDQPFELRITIPLRRHWKETLGTFGLFLCTVVAGFLPLLDLATNTGLYLGEQPLLRIGLGSMFLTVSAFFLYLWLWIVAGREVVIVGYKSLTTRREILGFGIEREFELSRVHRLRYCRYNYEPEMQPNHRPLHAALQLHGWCGDIAFAYDGQTRSFGTELPRDEAKHLIQLIEKRTQKEYVPMPRIVSLIASATEIVCALGLEEQLVGRSHECDYPPSVKKLPAVTKPKFDVAGTSAEIDRRVKETLEQSLSVYHVDAERLRQLKPDAIVTQSHCEVCAVSEKDVERAVAEWTGNRPKVVSLAPNALEDVWTDIRRVGEALGVPERGEELLTTLRKRMAVIAEKTRALRYWPTVVCIEWIEPLMAAGNWMPELITMAGGLHPFGKAGQHAPRLTWEELVEKDPEVIVVLPCGWDAAKARQEMSPLTGKAEWPGLRAVRGNRVYLADGNQYFNRPGPRLVESLEILAELLHPEVFHYGHEGTGWERF